VDDKTQKDSWRSPPEVFYPLNAKFRFRFDMAASDDNALCRRYFTAEDSALGRQWPRAWKWCNPPYSQPLPWVEHAAQYRRTVMLLNQDTSTELARLARRTAKM
jgi:phage N-6-adenine-methyltransferase